MDSNQAGGPQLDVDVIKRLFDLLRRNIWLLSMCFLLAGGAAFVASKFQTPIYEAKTQVMVTRSSSSSSPVTDVTQILNAQQLTQTYVELLQQDWVLDDVSTRVGGKVTSDQITISTATNTLILNISVEDSDPERAKQIADALVQVLVTQNESLQASRYTDAEQGLDLQIQQIQVQVAEVQGQLDLAKTGALDEKIAQIQEKIQTAQANKDAAQAELSRLNSLTLKNAQLLLTTNQASLQKAQTQLENQLAEYQAMNEKLTSDPAVKQDPQLAVALQSQMAEKGVAINATREEIVSLEKDITWLTPLAEQGILDKTRKEKKDYIALQDTLMASYQATYTDLLVSGNITLDTQEIAGLERDLSLYQQIYLNLVNSRETVRLQKMQNMPNVIQIKPAAASEQPVRPRTTLNSILGGIGGLVLAITVVLLSDFLDTTLKKREDIERNLDLPVIGYVPQLDKLNEKDGPYVANNPRSPAAESFRLLRTNLEFSGVDHSLKSILVSSPGASEGKTTIAVNLAAVIAQSGKRVVLLDADLRRPRLHREMGLPNRIGLSDVFREKATLKDVIQTWGDLGLGVITSGGLPPNPAELLGSDKMHWVLEQLEAEFDMVVVDSTPAIVADSQLVASFVDGVLLVLWPGHTHADTAHATVEQYRHVGARLLGVVLNNIQPGQGYGYGYSSYSNYSYYQYGSDETKAEQNGPVLLPWRRKKAPKGSSKASRVSKADDNTI